MSHNHAASSSASSLPCLVDSSDSETGHDRDESDTDSDMPSLLSDNLIMTATAGINTCIGNDNGGLADDLASDDYGTEPVIGTPLYIYHSYRYPYPANPNMGMLEEALILAARAELDPVLTEGVELDPVVAPVHDDAADANTVILPEGWWEVYSTTSSTASTEAPCADGSSDADTADDSADDGWAS